MTCLHVKCTPLMCIYLSALEGSVKETAVLQTAKFDNSTPTSKHGLLSRKGLVVKQLLKDFRKTASSDCHKEPGSRGGKLIAAISLGKKV